MMSNCAAHVNRRAAGWLARELIAGEGEAVEVADDGGGDGFRAEEFLRDLLDLLAGDRLNRGDKLFGREKAVEVNMVAREIGHPGGSRLERKQERALEMVFGATQLFFAHPVMF